MARKPQGPLTQADLAAFVAQEADFAFEMATLSALNRAGFSTEHAASYRDPISDKLRAFDIRAHWQNEWRSLRFAVECKNIRPSAPLLVHATPRSIAEALHTVMARYRIGTVFQDALPRVGVYVQGECVGRQTDQPMKDDTGGFKSSDASTYEKWSQAFASCGDLVQAMADESFKGAQAAAVVPVLAVPDGSLWQVDYDEEGSITSPVRQVDRCTLILRQSLSAQTIHGPRPFNISHVEICTLSALVPRLSYLSGEKGLLAGVDEYLAANHSS